MTSTSPEAARRMIRVGPTGRVGQVLPPSQTNNDPSGAVSIAVGNERPTMIGSTS